MGILSPVHAVVAAVVEAHRPITRFVDALLSAVPAAIVTPDDRRHG